MDESSRVVWGGEDEFSKSSGGVIVHMELRFSSKNTQLHACLVSLIMKSECEGRCSDFSLNLSVDGNELDTF